MHKGFKRGIMAVLLGAAMLLTVAGCSSTQEKNGSSEAVEGETVYPLTVQDDFGQEVTFEKAPEKVVSLSPANTEILFALEASDKIAGRTDYCNYPEEAQQVESVGDYNAPNIEKIISLTPDLILATDFISDDVRSQLEAAGAKVMVFSAIDIKTVQDEIIRVGQILNLNDQAAALTGEMQKKYDAIKEKTAGAETRRSVFIDIGDFYSSGEGSLLGTMLSDINATNIAADTGMDWPQLSVEQIIAANPDVYVSFLTTPEAIKAVPGFDQVKAIQENRICYYEMLSPDSDLIQRPGPRIVDGLELLAKDIYPELF